MTTEDDLVKLERGMKYLAGMPEVAITFRVEGPVCVTAYVDASFATHSSDMRSHTLTCRKLLTLFWLDKE